VNMKWPDCLWAVNVDDATELVLVSPIAPVLVLAVESVVVRLG